MTMIKCEHGVWEAYLMRNKAFKQSRRAFCRSSRCLVVFSKRNINGSISRAIDISQFINHLPSHSNTVDFVVYDHSVALSFSKFWHKKPTTTRTIHGLSSNSSGGGPFNVQEAHGIY